MSGAIFDPSVDVIDPFLYITPTTGSVFTVTGSVVSEVTTVQQTSSATNFFSISSTVTSLLALGANSTRKGASFYKEGGGDAYLLLGTSSASKTLFTVKLSVNSLYELPYNYTGEVHLVFSTAANNSFVSVTEFK